MESYTKLNINKYVYIFATYWYEVGTMNLYVFLYVDKIMYEILYIYLRAHLHLRV